MTVPVQAFLTGRGSWCQPLEAWDPHCYSSAEEGEGNTQHNTDPEKIYLSGAQGVAIGNLCPSVCLTQ